MRRPLMLLVPLALLAAGCAGDHSGHAGGGVALLFGVQNATNETVEVGWSVTALAEGALVWTRTELLEAGAPVERIEPLETRGEHRVDLSWGAARSAVFSWDTAQCSGTFHLVVALQPDGSAGETTRECHE